MSEYEADKLEESEPVLGRQMGCIVMFRVCFEKKGMSIGMYWNVLDCPLRLIRSSREEGREVHIVKLKSEEVYVVFGHLGTVRCSEICSYQWNI
jgi:hypothetical protein